MPRTFSLPSGHTATLREHTELTERQRRPFMKLSALVNNERLSPQESADALLDLMDSAIIAGVVTWSFEFPVTADSLLDLAATDVDALRDECMEIINASAPNFKPSLDQTSPTTPAPLS